MAALKTIASVFVVLAIAASLAETTVRLTGLVDVPLYNADAKIGYIPAANQSGAFLNKNEWSFNNRHMATWRQFVPTHRGDILLIGDSLVLGGNPYKDFERLGPALEEQMGVIVWPIAAPSWGLQNELEYLLENPDVASSVDRIVVLSNSGDFDQPSSWASDLTHPRTKPTLASWYFFERYVHDFDSPRLTPNTLKVQKTDTMQMMSEVRKLTNAPIDMFFYADQAEFNRGDRCLMYQLQQLGIPPSSIHCVTQSDWSSDLYRDEIHPTPAGTERIAKIIATALRHTNR